MPPSRRPASSRTTVRRAPQRGCYDKEVIAAILDEGMIAHVGFLSAGVPHVLPMAYARDGERILLHGSTASRLMRDLAAGAAACLTVTLLDGMVLARSAFHHSMNYRSVVAMGSFQVVEDPGEKLRAMDLLVERLVPGRTAHARRPNSREFKATLVLALPLDECSAKIRSGPAVDDPEDVGLPIWAGVIPLRLVAGPPEPGSDVPETVEQPDYVTRYAPERRPPASAK